MEQNNSPQLNQGLRRNFKKPRHVCALLILLRCRSLQLLNRLRKCVGNSELTLDSCAGFEQTTELIATAEVGIDLVIMRPLMGRMDLITIATLETVRNTMAAGRTEGSAGNSQTEQDKAKRSDSSEWQIENQQSLQTIFTTMLILAKIALPINRFSHKNIRSKILFRKERRCELKRKGEMNDTVFCLSRRSD